MKRYKFLDLKYSREAIPADVNAQFISVCRKFGDATAEKEVMRFAEKRWYGKVPVISAPRGEPVTVAEANILSGVVVDYKLYSFRENGGVLSVANIQNESVDMKKGDRNGKDVRPGDN
jgi:hypothetical protein